MVSKLVDAVKQIRTCFFNNKGHSLTFVVGHSDSTISKFFFLETSGPVEAKFHVEPSWDWGMEVSTKGLFHMTKMVAMSIYVGNL